MSTSKRPSSSKRQRSSMNPDIAYRQYLNNPNLDQEFSKYSSQDVHQERFINFPDFEHYPLEFLFKSTGLFELFSIANLVFCYPFLVRLFYTNMSTSTPPKSPYLRSNVKNIPLKLTPKRISEILNIPNTGVLLKDIKMNNPEILLTMFEDGMTLSPPIFNRALRPLPRLIGRILSHNILQKSGSFTYISLDLAKYIYAIMGEINVNWAQVIYNNLIKTSSSTLEHGGILTHVFKAFGVPVDLESDILGAPVPFNRAALARMHLPHNPNVVYMGDAVEEEADEEEEPIGDEDEEDTDEDEEEDHVPHHGSTSEPSFDYLDLTNRLETLTTNQGRIKDTQDRLVASHYVMQHQISQMRESQDDMRATQNELLRRFNETFPPPPP